MKRRRAGEGVMFCRWYASSRSRICHLNEPVAMLFRQVPCIPEGSGTLNKGLPITLYSAGLQLGHMILRPPTRRRRHGDMVCAQLEHPHPSVVCRTGCVGVAVVNWHLLAVVLQAVNGAYSVRSVVVGLAFMTAAFP